MCALVRTIDPEDQWYEEENALLLKKEFSEKYFELCWEFPYGRKRNALILGMNGKWNDIPSERKGWYRKYACNVNSEHYDSEFQDRLRQLDAPINIRGDALSPEDRKKVILNIASKNKSKIPFTLKQDNHSNNHPRFPDGTGHMGVSLVRYCGLELEKDKDEEFIKKLSVVAPNWIDLLKQYKYNDTFVARKQKEAVEFYMHLKKVAEQRPRVGINNLGYTGKKIDYKWTNRIKQIKARTPHLYQELREIAPQFFADNGLFSNNNTSKKLDCIDWANDKDNKLTWGGFGRSTDLNDLISSSIRVYCDTTKPKNGFDEKFYNKIKEIRPEWFDSKGVLIKPPSADDQFKDVVLEKSKTNDLDFLRENISSNVETMIYRYFKQDKNFRKTLKENNPYWFFGIEDGKKLSKAVNFQSKVENLKNFLIEGNTIPYKRGCLISGFWRQVKQPRKHKESRLYAFGYGVVKDLVKE